MIAIWKVLFVSIGLINGCGSDSSAPENLAGIAGIDRFSSKESLNLGGGKIDRVFEVHTFNEEITWVDDAHYEIEVRCYIGEDVGAPLTHKTSGEVSSLPIEYSIEGDEKKIFPDSVNGSTCYHFLLSASIYNHDGSESSVGDLVSEYSNSIAGLGFKKDIAVSGLESCGADNSGGFCASLGSVESDLNLTTVFDTEGNSIEYNPSKAWNVVQPGVSCCCAENEEIQVFDTQCIENGHDLVPSYESCCTSYCTGKP